MAISAPLIPASEPGTNPAVWPLWRGYQLVMYYYDIKYGYVIVATL